MTVASLEPRRHESPPGGWSVETFDKVSTALALALVASYRREHDEEEASA